MALRRRGQAPSGPNGSGDDQEDFWRSRRWWRLAGQTAIATWGSTALAFAGTVVAARALGPDGFGEVVLAVSTATLVHTLLDLTLEEAVVYHGMRALKAGHLGTLRALIRTSLRLDLAIGLAVVTIVVVAAAPLADLVSGGRLPAGILRLAALTGLVATIDGTTGGMLLLAGRPDLRAWILALANAARLMGVVVAVALGGGPEAVVAAYVIASAIGAAFQAFLAWRLGWRHWRAGGSPGGEPVQPRALLSFGLHTSLSTTMFAGRDLLIPIILGSLAGPAAVGLFRVALLPVTGVALLGAPVRLLLFPEQAKLAASRRFDALWRSIRAHTVAGLAIGVPGAVVGWFVLDTLIPLVFTEEFSGAVDASRILLIAAAAHLATGWWKTLPAAVGRPGLRTLVAGTSLTLTIALLALLGGQGSEGAALAYSLTSLLTASAWIVLARVLLARAQALAGAQPPDGPSERARAVARS